MQSITLFHQKQTNLTKVPIGTPVDNTSAYILDGDMMPVGKGKVSIIITNLVCI